MINTELLESNVNGTIHGMFDERAKYYPDRVAVRYKGKSYTYLEIKLKSNKLARYILKKTSYLSTKYIVGFYLEKSLETAISILGILKSGCAYVAIDTSYPPERIKYILNDCACSIILTCNKLYPIINKIIISLNLQDYIQLVIVDDVYINECSDNLPEQRVLAKQLAYIIYTSGSTGTPKGVMVSHQNVISSNQWVYEHTKCAENHVVDCSANLSFSATVNVLLMPLSYGHTVVMCDDECKQDPIKYINYLLEEGISLIKTTPSYLRGMLVVLKSTRIMLPRIKQLIVAGERLNQSDLLAWLDYAPNSNIIHHYGCTEITAGCLIYRNLNHKVISSCDYVPLNEISPNNKFYIVDGDLQQVASNVVGELCISGMNVALGYINNHKLTKEKFVENPFSKEKSYAKLYKTGDLVKRNSNGYIEFIGRRDSQVKVRGYRIELTEIEKALEAHSKLQKAVVLTSEDDNQKLIAYFTADCELLSDALAEHTQALLPNYMLPSLFIQIKEFPLTANKKIDIKVLRALKSTREIHVDDRPQTDLEKQLYKVWTDVLNLDNLGMQDDFFRVGGDSILSIQLVSKVRYLGIDLDVQDIFEQRNIKNLAKHICSSKAKHRITAEQGYLKGCFSLLPIQKSFFQINLAYPNFFNQAFLIKTPQLAFRKLQYALSELLAQHDALRLSFYEDSVTGMQQQYNELKEDIKIKLLDIIWRWL